MKFWEAMKAADEGKLVRAKSWSTKCYWGIEYNTVVGYSLTLNRCFWDEWEIYTGPPVGLSESEMRAGFLQGKKFACSLENGWYEVTE